jgi:hypothetical protein
VAAAFDLDHERGREGLVLWYVRHGFAELGLNRSVEDEACVRQLRRAWPRAKQFSFLPITWLMRILADRFFGKCFLPLGIPERQVEFLHWYFARGLTEANLESFLTPEQGQALLDRGPHGTNAPKLLECIWMNEPPLSGRFAGSDDVAFHNWCMTEGAQTFPILAHPLIGLAPAPARRDFREKPFRRECFLGTLTHAPGQRGRANGRVCARECGHPFRGVKHRARRRHARGREGNVLFRCRTALHHKPVLHAAKLDCHD